MKPLSLFVDSQKFAVPSATVLPIRVVSNLNLFHANYFAVGAVILIWAVLSKPLFLISVALVGALMFYTQRYDVTLPNGFVLAGRQKAIASAGLSALIILFLAGSTILNMIGLTVCAVMLHASFHIGEQQPTQNQPIQLPPVAEV